MDIKIFVLLFAVKNVYGLIANKDKGAATIMSSLAFRNLGLIFMLGLQGDVLFNCDLKNINSCK